MFTPSYSLSQADRRRSVLTRALVHLPESEQAESLIRTAVAIARRCRAHLRGLTVVDMSELHRLAIESPSAVHLLSAAERMEGGESRREEIRSAFSQACLAAKLDFDLRRVSGDSLDLLPAESRFHDLSAFAVVRGRKRSGGEIAVADAVRLLTYNAGPTLAMRSGAGEPKRGLLVLDNSPASSRAVRSFLAQDPFELTTVRALAIGADADEAQTILREQIDPIRRRYPECESGFLVGRSVRLAAKYADQWQADLVVIGARRSPPVMRYLFGETAREILARTDCSIYATS